MAEDLDKPLLDPENFNREGIDLVSSANKFIKVASPFCFILYFNTFLKQLCFPRNAYRYMKYSSN